MDFNNLKTRKECISLMQEISNELHGGLEARLKRIMTPAEVMIQDYVQSIESIWWKNFHNLFVPANMISISNNEGYNRDLLYAAQIHDAGNSLIKIAETIKGADWENVDKRREHMRIGGIMIYSLLGFLRSSGQIKISDERILKLRSIVETHDDPYIGGQLDDKEAQAHRCADICWVPSALSFYKDLITYCGDEKYLEKSQTFGLEISSKTLLEVRMASFYENECQLPHGWNIQFLPLIPEIAPFGAVGRCEPSYTITGKRLVDNILSRRASEIGPVSEANTPQQFADLFSSALRDEADYIFSVAEGK